MAASSSFPTAAAFLTTNIVGGMGNQLFLIANLLATSRRTGIPAYVEPVSFSSSAEAPRATYWNSLFCDMSQHHVSICACPAPSLPVVPVPEVRPVRKIQLDKTRACVYNLIGFFQSEGFFEDYPMMSSVIPMHMWQTAKECLTRHYTGASSHAVALHVRRGDYTRFTDIFEQLDVVDYYDVAVRQLLGGLLQRPSPSPSLTTVTPLTSARCPIHLLVFCDEERFGHTVVGFFRTKYSGVIDVSLVCAANEINRTSSSDATGTAQQTTPMPRDVLELLMMAQCNDVIMANSTFSWWGAYLNRVPLRRIIAPSKWFVKDPYPASNHLYCPGWMLI